MFTRNPYNILINCFDIKKQFESFKNCSMILVKAYSIANSTSLVHENKNFLYSVFIKKKFIKKKKTASLLNSYFPFSMKLSIKEKKYPLVFFSKFLKKKSNNLSLKFFSQFGKKNKINSSSNYLKIKFSEIEKKNSLNLQLAHEKKSKLRCTPSFVEEGSKGSKQSSPKLMEQSHSYLLENNQNYSLQRKQKYKNKLKVLKENKDKLSINKENKIFLKDKDQSFIDKENKVLKKDKDREDNKKFSFKIKKPNIDKNSHLNLNLGEKEKQLQPNAPSPSKTTDSFKGRVFFFEKKKKTERGQVWQNKSPRPATMLQWGSLVYNKKQHLKTFSSLPIQMDWKRFLEKKKNSSLFAPLFSSDFENKNKNKTINNNVSVLKKNNILLFNKYLDYISYYKLLIKQLLKSKSNKNKLLRTSYYKWKPYAFMRKCAILIINKTKNNFFATINSLFEHPLKKSKSIHIKTQTVYTASAGMMVTKFTKNKEKESSLKEPVFTNKTQKSKSGKKKNDYKKNH